MQWDPSWNSIPELEWSENWRVCPLGDPTARAERTAKHTSKGPDARRCELSLLPAQMFGCCHSIPKIMHHNSGRWGLEEADSLEKKNRQTKTSHLIIENKQLLFCLQKVVFLPCQLVERENRPRVVCTCIISLAIASDATSN